MILCRHEATESDGRVPNEALRRQGAADGGGSGVGFLAGRRDPPPAVVMSFVGLCPTLCSSFPKPPPMAVVLDSHGCVSPAMRWQPSRSGAA